MEADAVEVEVEAEDEVDRRFLWRCKLKCHAPIRPMAMAWAEAHGVLPEAVGFEDMEEELVDLSCTPAELGWRPEGGLVRLRAIPMDEQFAEKLPDTQLVDEVGHETASHVAVREMAKDTPSVRETKRKQKTPRVEEEEEEVEARAPPAKKPKASSTTKQKESKVPAELTETKPAKSKARTKGDQAKNTEKKTKKGAKASPAPSQKNGGCFPDDDERVFFEQDNPKKAGGASHGRYERYKAGETCKEALALGAARGDLVHDFKKGFMKRA